MTDQNESTEQQMDSELPGEGEETTEQYMLLDEDLEGEPNEPEEEPEDLVTRVKREEVELRFARYERNYRSRRIRERTLTPYKRTKRGRPRNLIA